MFSKPPACAETGPDYLAFLILIILVCPCVVYGSVGRRCNNKEGEDLGGRGNLKMEIQCRTGGSYSIISLLHTSSIHIMGCMGIRASGLERVCNYLSQLFGRERFDEILAAGAFDKLTNVVAICIAGAEDNVLF